MRKVIWVLVSTKNNQEAEKIGTAVLQKRLSACFGIYPRFKSVYFWPASTRGARRRETGPPKSNKLETSRGPLLVLETLPENVQKISQTVKKLHSDQVPFIGWVTINNLNKEFYEWMRGEL